MDESILNSIKKMLGIVEDYNYFDPDIIMCINTVLSVLSQLGVGPEEGFSISNADSVWSDFLPETGPFEMVKSFVHLRVRLLFDPPQSGPLVEAFERQAKELEWRLQVAADPKPEHSKEK